MAKRNPIESLPTERMEVARAAIGQLDALLHMLARERHDECFDLVLTSALIRMKDLSSVVMSVIGGDSGRETAEMEQVANGMWRLARFLETSD